MPAGLLPVLRPQVALWRVDDRKRKQLEVRKGLLTRMKNRVGNGVCPCCNRHFKNLQGHMKTKHPEFKDSES